MRKAAIVSVRMDTELHTSLKVLAKAGGISTNEFINRALRDAVRGMDADKELQLCHRCYGPCPPGSEYCSVRCASRDHPEWLLGVRVWPLDGDELWVLGEVGYWVPTSRLRKHRGYRKGVNCINCGAALSPDVEGVNGQGAVWLTDKGHQLTLACRDCSMPVGEKDLEFFKLMEPMTPEQMREKWGHWIR